MRSLLILFCYCTVVYGLFQEIGIAYTASDWQLFVDTCKQSLKAVLLYRTNLFPLISVICAVQKMKDQELVKPLIELIQYSNYNGTYVVILK